MTNSSKSYRLHFRQYGLATPSRLCQFHKITFSEFSVHPSHIAAARWSASVVIVIIFVGIWNVCSHYWRDTQGEPRIMRFPVQFTISKASEKDQFCAASSLPRRRRADLVGINGLSNTDCSLNDEGHRIRIVWNCAERVEFGNLEYTVSGDCG